MKKKVLLYVIYDVLVILCRYVYLLIIIESN